MEDRCVSRTPITWKPARLFSKSINWNTCMWKTWSCCESLSSLWTQVLYKEEARESWEAGGKCRRGTWARLMAVIICHERTRGPELLAAAVCCWSQLLPCSLLAKECVNRPYILASVPQNVAQHKMPLDVSFPSWPSSQLLTVSQQKKRTERDLKLLFSRAHSTHHQTWPLPALLTAPLPHPSSRKGKREHFFEYFYLLLFPTAKDFSTMFYTLVMGLININDNPTTLTVADLSISKYGIYV